LLQGCGVGFRPNVGVLNGFTNELELEIIRSEKVLPTDDDGNPVSDSSIKGNPENVELYDKDTGIWYIRVGDSAEAWAKFFGKIMAFKLSATKLVVDFSEIRPAGYRLSGYGWISSGDEQIAKAIKGIVKIMNRSAGKILSAIDIHEIENHLGTILSSRRSAEISLYPYGEPEWEEFAMIKKDHYLSDETMHLGMSNNSLLFYHKPTKRELKKIFRMIEEGGGAEPGFINAIAALKRAPYFKGVNPCAEILLGDKSFCNLVEVAVSRFNGNEEGLHRALYIVARANYRQTCVNLDDGVLQRTWHELNEFLRLCGVGLTGIIGWEFHTDPDALEDLRRVAHKGCDSMADELGLPRAQLKTTVKPSGTQSKVFGLVGDEVPEGAHKPLAKYIFNRIRFPATDPMLQAIADAGYTIEKDPYSDSDRLVVVPVEYPNVEFDVAEVGGVKMEVNLEPAVDQLERYKLLNTHYVDHNCSITIYYDPTEVPAIVDWLAENWDSYVGVSFLYRTDPTKTAADLGFPYLPQQPVDEATFRAYADTLVDIDFTGTDSEEMLDMEDCAGGACPIR
jgi:ribonucleoside-triphosphate reductase